MRCVVTGATRFHGTLFLYNCIPVVSLRAFYCKMADMRIRQLFVLLALGLCACDGGDVRRAPYEGFEWTELSGAGLVLKAQRNENIRLMADPELPGIVMVRTGDAHPRALIRVFDLERGAIEEVADRLRSEEGWNDSLTCRFKEIKSPRRGVRRYVMVPDGDYARRMEAVMKAEQVPSTCNGWGVGNSGMRWFEIHDDRPDKALFMEIGQEAPLFDENSVEFGSDVNTGTLSEDVLYTLSGTLLIGHEVRSFRPDGGDEFWFVDRTGRLEQMYDSVTGGEKNGEPCRAILKVEYNGRWDEGFAADYDGVFFVREVVDLKKAE